MDKNNLEFLRQDFHIHATAYRNRDPQMNIKQIIEKCSKRGIRFAGIMEHLDDNHPVATIMKIKAEFAKIGLPRNIIPLFGCEASA